MALSGVPPTSTLKVVPVPAALRTILPPSSISPLNPKEDLRPVLSSARRATLASRWAEAPSLSVAASTPGDFGSLEGRTRLPELRAFDPPQFDPLPQLQVEELSQCQGSTLCHCSERSARHLKASQHQEPRHKFPAAYGAMGLSVFLNTIQSVGSALSSTTEQIDTAIPISQVMPRYLFLADLDPATAKTLIGVTGPFLSAFGFLFIIRIVMSWYPKLPVGQFPYVIAYAPTEPILSITRRLIPPLGGVDVTPVVWFGLLSFLNEILVGPQGLLVLLSQQVQ